ncbi:MAG: LLM class flavin-dependent oxidoreductase [Chloroflexi bacterium]|nr:LLM class flavin-dependent oxidoreductase [Chloroflexota bacterium]MDA1227011.1 LLM class flavin-dependent oxidoreductase [Chloroflexota bacterium]
MKIGMSLTSSYPGTGNTKTIMDNLIEEVELMAKLGFDSLSLGDHHVTTNDYIQVLPAMSRLSAYSGDMQLLPLFLLPFYNPILLAEQLGTLDVMSGGKTTIICALGHQPEAHVAYQTPQRVRVCRFVETFEILKLLSSQDNVSYQGKHYAFENVSISPKPLNRRLPMWMGCSADLAVRRAARLADAWVIEPGWPPDTIDRKLGVYRSELGELGRTDEVSETILRRDIHLAATNDAARSQARGLFEKGYRGYGAQQMAESLIVGGPDECVSYIQRMEEMGINHLLFRCALDDRANAMQTIQMLGEEVIPRFR